MLRETPFFSRAPIQGKEAEGGLVDVEAVNNGKTYYGQRRQVTIY